MVRARQPMPHAQSAISGSKRLSRGIAFFKIDAHCNFAFSLNLQRDFPDTEQQIP
jgi:hypothetical protein